MRELFFCFKMDKDQLIKWKDKKSKRMNKMEGQPQSSDWGGKRWPVKG